MSSFNKHIVSGRVGGKPELRYTPNGSPVTSFSLARQPRHLNKATGQWEDGEVTWYEVTAWSRLAENIAQSLDSGFEVTVIGEIALESYQARDGAQKSKLKIKADDVTVSLDHQIIQVVDKSAYGNKTSGGTSAPAARPTTPVDDEAPF